MRQISKQNLNAPRQQLVKN